MKRLRFKLLLSLVTFALILVVVMSYVNRQILVVDIREQEAANRTLIEDHILNDMQTVDNAHLYFDKNISDKIETELRALVSYYAKNPSISTWDLQQMKKEHEMDIYILDQTNTIIYTTFMQDKGFSFSECCKNFSSLLDERRESGKFYTDGIDVSTTTGAIRKFGYLGTPDQKYLFELGVDLNDVPVFHAFNFVTTANSLVEKYSDLIEVKTINAGGIFLDDSQDTRIVVGDQSELFQEYYKKAKQTMQPTEYKKQLENGYVETVRFLPYEAETARGDSTNRIVYVKYGNLSELTALAKNTKQFWFLLVIAVVTSLIMLFVIIRLLTKTINLATYDSLTGVYNRATYISKMDNLLKKRKENTPGLLLIDLDNFKQVNDQFGHAEGDKVLVETASVLNQAMKNEGFVVRLGGDEFAIVLYDTDNHGIKKIADAILHKIRSLKYMDTKSWATLSVSIGGAIYESVAESEISLFERADQALYRSKNEGKNCYSSYDEVATDKEIISKEE
ncbi:membrane protein [Lysinibacillus contaminans]|uniref:Membrane protein n=1 Tax=Lysinibacillus contaminans TaxID=1293441 RepID=A0ABR5JYN4_9BACI|nr:GGDEF domain-containing protein [Lysinibacillus contaminans]KOS67591.1 membrane protein [Lysinibacillus contaminans]